MRRIPMFVTAIGLATVTLCSSGPAAAATSEPSKKPASVSKDGWPNTREGELARRWVQAFSKGEKAMRATLPEILAAESLAKTSMDERMERYRISHEKLGTLMLVKIEKSSPGELVAALASSDQGETPFTFKFQTAAPYKLISVSRTEHRQMHGHGGGFSH